MSETHKLIGSSIQRRRKRIEAFRRFVSSHRKQKTVQELIAIFSLEFGIRRKVVEEYLRLLLDSGIYKKHHLGYGRLMLLTEAEYEKETN